VQHQHIVLQHPLDHPSTQLVVHAHPFSPPLVSAARRSETVALRVCASSIAQCISRAMRCALLDTRRVAKALRATARTAPVRQA
jgi:hypothetical protein